MRCARRASALLVVAVSACNGDGSRSGEDRVRLPTYFRLDALAEAQEGDFSVECSIDFIVEIAGEVSRTDGVIEYVATMGGGANRAIYRADGSGVAYFAEAHYPELQVLHILPDRIQLVSPKYPPDEPVSSRFWAELLFWEGALQPDGSILGSWTCAPMDVDDHGIEDFTVFADGTWFTTPLSR